MTKRYLVIGIDDYTGQDSSGNSNLGCCVSDANSIGDLLVSSFGFDADESVKLTDQQATSSGILDVLKNLLQKSAPGDVVALYYSGHGSRQSGSPAQADCDLFYESIVPASGAWITDRDLFKLADSLQPSVVNFTVILDSCHSGGMDQETDSAYKCRSPLLPDDLATKIEHYLHTLIPCGILIPLDANICSGNVTPTPTDAFGHPTITEDPDKVFVDTAKTTLIAGCKFDELSYETAGHGLLTNALLKIVNSSDFQINYGDMLDRLRASVQDDFSTLIRPKLSASSPQNQTPQLRGQKNRMG